MYILDGNTFLTGGRMYLVFLSKSLMCPRNQPLQEQGRVREAVPGRHVLPWQQKHTCSYRRISLGEDLHRIHCTDHPEQILYLSEGRKEDPRSEAKRHDGSGCNPGTGKNRNGQIARQCLPTGSCRDGNPKDNLEIIRPGCCLHKIQGNRNQ